MHQPISSEEFTLKGTSSDGQLGESAQRRQQLPPKKE